MPMQALHETHKILGQVDILGSPIVLGSSIVTGVRQFISEPLKAHNPKQFVIGLGHGTLALVKYGAFGFLLAIEQVGLAVRTVKPKWGAMAIHHFLASLMCFTEPAWMMTAWSGGMLSVCWLDKHICMGAQLLGGTAKGLAVLTMDQEFINRFRVRPVTYRQRMLQGLQGAGVGIYEGITGGPAHNALLLAGQMR